MASTPRPERDPLRLQALIALAFTAIAAWHLGVPAKPYFDEIHYVPAARALLALRLANAEHPLVGKEAIAGAMLLLGDHPWVWRLPSLAAGGIGLFAFGRALWWASARRFAALAAMVLLASDFAWFVQSRIAMLDMVMAGLTMVALWHVAAAVARPAQARLALAAAGVALGLALGAKWSMAPVAMALGAGFFAVRWHAAGRRVLGASRAAPIPGITLAEAAWWLGTVPLLTYGATFTPAFFYHDRPVSPLQLGPWHHTMLQLQASVVQHHPYQTQWWQWVIDQRGIWYLYEVVDGAQRGIMLIGNPLTMVAGLPALGWCLWAGILRRRADALALAALYLATLGLWVVAAKPVQFYYHYLLPGTFLMGCLALALDEIRAARRTWSWAAPITLAMALGLFVQFYPILSAAPLSHGKASFEQWMWLASWR